MKTKQEIQTVLHQFSKMSNDMYGSYAHCAGFYESIITGLLSDEFSQKQALDIIESWIAQTLDKEYV